MRIEKGRVRTTRVIIGFIGSNILEPDDHNSDVVVGVALERLANQLDARLLGVLYSEHKINSSLVVQNIPDLYKMSAQIRLATSI